MKYQRIVPARHWYNAYEGVIEWLLITNVGCGKV